jgi:hypothetical protein
MFKRRKIEAQITHYLLSLRWRKLAGKNRHRIQAGFTKAESITQLWRRGIENSPSNHRYIHPS